MHEGLHKGYLQPGHPTAPTNCPFLVLTYLADGISLAAGTWNWSLALNPTGKTALVGLTVLVEGFAQGQRGTTFPRDRTLPKVLLLFPPLEENFWPATPLPCCFLAGSSLRGDGYGSRLLPVPLACIHGYRRTLCNSQSRLCFCSLDLSPADFPPQPSFP